VKDVVRVCDPSYNTAKLLENDIRVVVSICLVILFIIHINKKVDRFFSSLKGSYLVTPDVKVW